ncbi:MAG: GntR family transcriptional regulator [Alphaproteobacteria bacterium]|nr:GntR family transcriptional regulator [Alphaproteobacteria bacterium]
MPLHQARRTRADPVEPMPSATRPALDGGVGAILRRGERGNLHHEAVTVLRRMIIEGELKFGRRLPENELCRQLGISRTPFREAMRVLSSEGLVTLLPRRGAVVATPSVDEFKGLFLAIGAVEGACAPLACDHLTIAEVERVKRLHAEMVEAAEHGRRRDYSVANEAIHAAIVAGAGNEFLRNLHASLTLRVSRVRFFIDTPREAWRRAMDEHREILQAVEARQGPQLAALLIAHMDKSCGDFEHLLRQSTRLLPTGRFITL